MPDINSIYELANFKGMPGVARNTAALSTSCSQLGLGLPLNAQALYDTVNAYQPGTPVVGGSVTYTSPGWANFSVPAYNSITITAAGGGGGGDGPGTTGQSGQASTILGLVAYGGQRAGVPGGAGGGSSNVTGGGAAGGGGFVGTFCDKGGCTTFSSPGGGNGGLCSITYGAGALGGSISLYVGAGGAGGGNGGNSGGDGYISISWS